MWGVGAFLIILGVLKRGQGTIHDREREIAATEIPGVYFAGGAFFIIVSLLICFLVLGRQEDPPKPQKGKTKKKKKRR
jgi:hypothetical protein